MNEPEISDAGNLVVGSSQSPLVRHSLSNPLLARGLADVARSALCRETGVAVSFYLRGVHWNEKGEFKNAEKALKEAIRRFETIISVDPHNAFAYRHRAKARWVKSVNDEALSDERDVQEPTKSDGKFEYCNSMKDFDEAIRLEPGSPLAFIERAAAVNWGFAVREDIIRDLDQAVKVDPHNASCRAICGIIRLDIASRRASFPLGIYDNAIEDLKIALGPTQNESPKVVVVFTDLQYESEALEDGNKDTGGNPTLRASTQIDVRSALVRGYSQRGDARFNEGDFEGAIQDYDEVIRLSPSDASAYYDRGWARQRLKEYSGAFSDFEEAIRLDPDNKERAVFSRGRIWLETEEYDNAIQDFNESLELLYKAEQDWFTLFFQAKREIEAHYWRGCAWLEKGSLDEAVRDFDEAIRRNPQYEDAYFSRGRAWLDKGDYDKAIYDFDQAIRLNPSASSYYARRAYAHSMSGDNEKAIQDYDEALRLGPRTAIRFLGRGNCYLAKKDFENAIQDFEEASRINPHCFDAYTRRSHALRCKGMHANSVEWSQSEAFQVEIELPGQLFIWSPTRGRSAVLFSSTPGIVEISPRTLSQARERVLIPRKERYEKLRALNAPDIILTNERRILERIENAGKNPEDHAFVFRPTGPYSESTTPDKGLVALASVTDLEVVDPTKYTVSDTGFLEPNE